MPTNTHIDKFSDPYRKPILDDGTIDNGILLFSSPFSFSLSSGTTYSLTSKNVYVHQFDNEIYPASYSSATGFSVFATSGNSYSGHYYVALMQLFNQQVTQDFKGLYSITSTTAAVSSTITNNGKFDPSLYQGVNLTANSFSATITGLHVFNWHRSVYGDRMLDGTIKIWANNTLIAEEPFISRNVGILTLSSSQLAYQDSLTSAVKFWVLPDYGKLILWSSNDITLKSLSAITTVEFYNSIAVANQTLNLLIEPEEYNVSDNNSFYQKDFQSGDLPDPWITTVNLYNPWGDLIAIAKIEKPLRKSNVPITIKTIMDCI